MKKAFTLLELVVVIVITGILSLVGIELSVNIYRGYLQSRAINTLQAETELVLEQIAKRLAIRIKGSSIGRQTGNINNFISTEDPGLNNTFDILEWISYSYETFQYGGWSGFIDLNHANTARTRLNPADTITTTGSIETPFSSLANAWTDIANLTNNGATTAPVSQIGVLFKGTPFNVQNSFGYNTTTNRANAIARVNNFRGNTTINIDYPVGNRISEQYYLLHTAYAVVPTNRTANNDFTLQLRYNYRPWVLGSNFQNANSAILARNVTSFNFTETNGVIVLKLCMRDGRRSLDNAEDETTVCKTKAVY